MSNDENTQYLKQLSLNLQIKIGKLIIFLGITFYIIYVLTQLVFVFRYLNKFQKSQFTYLNTLGNQIKIKQENNRISILNFLDSTAKLLKYTTNVNSFNSTCNQEIYICSYSITNNYEPFNQYASIIKANSPMIKNKDITGMVLLANSSFAILNITYLTKKISTESALYYKIITKNSLIVNPATITYQFMYFPVNSTTLLTFCCSNLMSNSNDTLCIIFNSNIVSSVGSNYYFIRNYDIPSNLTQNAYSLFLKIVSNYFKDTYQNTVENIGQCLQVYPSRYGKYLNLDGINIACKQNQNYLFNFFGFSHLFVSYSYINSLDIPTPSQSVYTVKYNIIYIIISSNETFYSRSQDFKSNTLSNIRVTGYFLMLILAISLFFIKFSNGIIQDILLYSIDTLLTLGEYLKNKQQKQFNRRLSRNRPKILQFIIIYFKQFLWIQKLKKFKGKYKYKKLLFDGIQLFDQKDYISVLKFIYGQLIILQILLVQKLYKIKQLPHKKKQYGSRYQQTEKIIHKNIIIHDQKINKRRNANFNLLNPDDDQLMKNISISYRGNRGVRFSNDIQTIEIDQGPILRKAKFAESPMVSCETIKNDLSELDESIKRSDYKDSLKSLKSQQQSFTSLIDISRGVKKKDSNNKSRSLQSIHADLDIIKLDEQIQDDELLLDQQSQQDEIYNMTRQQIIVMIGQSYQKIINYYQRLIQLINEQLLQIKDIQNISQLVNYIYLLTIKKYQYFYYLLQFQNQNYIQKQERSICKFQDFQELSRNYDHCLSIQLIQQAEILQQSINQVQRVPISFEKLEDLCKSNIKKIRIAARQLLALAAEDYQPHLDLVLARNVYANLKQQKTTNTVKQQNLKIFMRNLQRYTNFWKQLQQLQKAAQFYNKKSKKFYFLVSITSLKSFTPVLTKLYDLLDNFDIFNIHNLEEETVENIIQGTETNENIQAKQRRRTATDKIKYLINLQAFIDSFSFSNQKGKESAEMRASSVKTINKRRIYQKQFHDILRSIEQEDIQSSKYIVILLGDEHSISSGDTEESSSTTKPIQRSHQQRIYQQISAIIEKGYLHFILIGYHLDSYPSKYGRLKKYIKISPELVEVELSLKQQQESLKKLEKYLQ